MMFLQQKSNIATEIGHTKPCDEIFQCLAITLATKWMVLETEIFRCSRPNLL